MALIIEATLKGVVPKTTRKLSVPDDATLMDLSDILIIAFGWKGAREHRFTRNGRGLCEVPDPIHQRDFEEYEYIDDHLGSPMEYEYDFFHSWKHTLSIKAVDGECDHPVLMEWRNHNICEHIDGYRDYNKMVKAAKDPKNRYHAQAVEWLRDCRDVDADEVNRGFSKWREDEFYSFFEPTLFDPLLANCDDMMLSTMALMDSAKVPTIEFRCSACGTRSQGRMRYDLNTSFYRNVPRYPVEVACPSCSRRTIVKNMNDGYNSGYTADDDFSPQAQMTDYYDMIERIHHSEMDPLESAEAHAEAMMMRARYRFKDPGGYDEKALELLKGMDMKDDAVFDAYQKVMAAKVVFWQSEEGLDIDASRLHGCDGALIAADSLALSKASDDEFVDEAVRIGDAVDISVDPWMSMNVWRHLLAVVIIRGLSVRIDEFLPKWFDSAFAYMNDGKEHKSCEWSRLCAIFESVAYIMHSMGRDDDAISYSQRMADAFLGKKNVPETVNSIVGFRLGMCIAGIPERRDEVVRLLKDVVDSLVRGRECGYMSTARVGEAVPILIDLGEKGELDIAFTIARSNLSMGFEDEFHRIMDATVAAALKKKIPVKKIEDSMKRFGIKTSAPVKRAKGTFEPKMLWGIDIWNMT